MNPITVDYFNNMIKELDKTTYYSNNNVPLKRTKPVLKSQFEDIDIYKKKDINNQICINRNKNIYFLV